jgi:hypothetical protein
MGVAMIIRNSAVHLQSQHQAQQISKRSESLRVWIDKPEDNPDKGKPPFGPPVTMLLSLSSCDFLIRSSYGRYIEMASAY